MQSGEPIVGEPFSLSCNVVVVNTTLEIGEPVIEILGPPDSYSGKFVCRFKIPTANSSVTYIHTVHFATLQASHGGKYLCHANFSLLTITDEVTLSVKSKQSLRSIPMPTGTVYSKCRCTLVAVIILKTFRICFISINNKIDILDLKFSQYFDLKLHINHTKFT